jgi:hypothetical protein
MLSAGRTNSHGNYGLDFDTQKELLRLKKAAFD